MSQPASDPRSARIFKTLFVIVGALFVVGAIALTVSMFVGPGNAPSATPTTEINSKEIARSQKAQESHDRDRKKWYTDGVSSVCRYGINTYPALEYGAEGRVQDMAQAVGMFMKDLREIAAPKAVDNQEAVKAVLDRGNALEAKWAELAKRPGPVPQPEQFAAVDEVRTYIQDLINNGADAHACGEKKLLPRPNPPMNPVQPAPAPAPATTPAAPAPLLAPTQLATRTVEP